MKPTQDDFRILFEEQYEKYLKNYLPELLNLVDDSDIDEIKELDEPDRTISLFEIIFTVPFSKIEDDYSEAINCFADEYLPYEVEAQYNDEKSEITVIIDEKNYVIKEKNGCDIIRKFNELIAPEYEIRILKIAADEDDEILTALILSNKEWQAFEKEYKERVGEIFVGIDCCFQKTL